MRRQFIGGSDECGKVQAVETVVPVTKRCGPKAYPAALTLPFLVHLIAIASMRRSLQTLNKDLGISLSDYHCNRTCLTHRHSFACRKEVGELLIQPLHILRALTRTTGPVAPDGRKSHTDAHALLHVRDFVLRILRGCHRLVVDWAETRLDRTYESRDRSSQAERAPLL